MPGNWYYYGIAQMIVIYGIYAILAIALARTIVAEFLRRMHQER